jgi:hypothetical protein
MKLRVLIFAFALIYPIVVVAQEAGWIKYNSAEGRYEVFLPNQAKLSTQQLNVDTGEAVTQYMALGGNDTHGFMAAYFDYPAGTTFSLDKVRDALVERGHATLLRDERITFGYFVGRRVRVTVKFGSVDFINDARFYDANGRIYALQCIFPKSEEGAVAVKNCNRFFDSFKISK